MNVQSQSYELRRRDLNRTITDVLLAQEAQKRQSQTFAAAQHKNAAVQDFLVPPERKLDPRPQTLNTPK